MNKKKSLRILTFLIPICSFLIISCPNPFVIQVLDPKTVTFETNGGSYIESQPVYRGYPVRRPSDPSRSGHAFDAWYVDNETFQRQWNFNAVPSSNITLYANWWVEDTSLIETAGRTLSPDDTVNIRNGESITFLAAAGYTNHIWTLNGVNVGSDGRYVFNTADYDKEPGRNYTIGLKVQKDGKYYFTSTSVRIMGAEIAVKTQPMKLVYEHGDALELSGLVVTLTYDDGTAEDAALGVFVSKNISVSPANGTVLSHSAHNNQPVTVSYGGKTVQTSRLTVAKVEQQAGRDTIINYWVDDTGEINIGTEGQPVLSNTVTVQNGGSVTFTAGDDYEEYRWTFNGTDVAPVGEPSSYTFDTSDHDKETGRNYTIGLMVKNGEKYYFTQITVRVEG